MLDFPLRGGRGYIIWAADVLGQGDVFFKMGGEPGEKKSDWEQFCREKYWTHPQKGQDKCWTMLKMARNK